MKRIVCLVVAVAAALVGFPEDLSQPIRPGGVNGSPFWNGRARMFLYAPAFDFPPNDRAVRYRFEIYDSATNSLSFEADRPTAPLTPVWNRIPTGFVTVWCLGVDKNGRSFRLPYDANRVSRTFWKSAPFKAGSYPKAPRGYGEAAARCADHFFHRKAFRTFLETGKPDMKALTVNCYPSKTHAATIEAMLDYARRCPDKATEALRLARTAADYLISISEPEGKPLAHFPPTYEGKAEVAGARQGLVMLIYPADVGMAFLRFARQTGETRYLAAAERIASTYLRLQEADGTWSLLMRASDGAVIWKSRLQPIGVIRFLEALATETGKAAYRASADRAFMWVREHPLRDWDWAGQFEDMGGGSVNIIENTAPTYANPSEHAVIDAALYALERYPDDPKARAFARDAVRYAEDQFVCWERPCNAAGRGLTSFLHPPSAVGNSYFHWTTPCALEQYGYYVPVDASLAKMIRGYLALYKAEGKSLDLEKAKALGDTLVRLQKPNGFIPTEFYCPAHYQMDDGGWPNCASQSIQALFQLADVTDAPKQVEVRVRQTPGGPKLFVDGKRHLARSVLVIPGTMPRSLKTDWQDYDLPFTPKLVGKKACLQFRFESKTYYGGLVRPDGWVRFRNLTVVDEAGRTVVPVATDDATVRRQWQVWDAGEYGQMTFESNRVIRVDVTKPKNWSHEWSTSSKFGNFHVIVAPFPVEAGRTYHARFQARADREQDFNPTAYQVPGYTRLPIAPDPFDETVRMAKEVGVDLIIPVGVAPTWHSDGSLTFEKADALFDRVIAINPNALVMARFWIHPTPQQFEAHPDWRTKFADGKTQNDESPSCLPWREYSTRLVDSFARHLMAKYPRNFAGMHLTAHRAGEWLYEDMLCGKPFGFDEYTRAAWRRTLAAAGYPDAATAEVPTVEERRGLDDDEMVADPAKEGRLILFHRMLNTEMADRILELAEVARKATDGKKLVAVFYGYSYEVASYGPFSGHCALDYLLKRANGNIDFLCGPFSYSGRAQPDTRPVMGPADTVARYGVMWWNEDDTRTYRETNADALQEQKGVPQTKPQSLATLERNNRQNGQRGHGCWWMDLRGRGWFLDRDLWQIMEKTRPYEEERLLSDAPYAPEVATIVSEENILHRRTQFTWPVGVLTKVNQRTFERCGVATGQYLLEDVVDRDIPARVRFYETSWYLSKADRAKLRAQRAARPDLVRVWMWASGYSDETGKGVEKVTDATGFKVRKVKDSRYAKASPLFAVEPEPGDEVWGTYEDGSAAIVARPVGHGGWEIFHGFPNLEEATILRVLKK